MTQVVKQSTNDPRFKGSILSTKNAFFKIRSLMSMKKGQNLTQLLQHPLTKFGGKITNDFLNSKLQPQPNFIPFHLVYE